MKKKEEEEDEKKEEEEEAENEKEGGAGGGEGLHQMVQKWDWFGEVSSNDAITAGISKVQGRMGAGQGLKSQWDTCTDQEIDEFSIHILDPNEALPTTGCSAWCSDLEEP